MRALQKWCHYSLTGGAMLLLTPQAALARDLASLSTLLTPAYSAMSLASACMADPGWAKTQPRGPRGTVFEYAQHVKDEIVVQLTYGEAINVLRGAAEVARTSTIDQLRVHVVAGDIASERDRLRMWCEGRVWPVIEKFITEHDRDHSAFMVEVEQAASR